LESLKELQPAHLKSTGIESTALKVGDHVPSLILQDAKGEQVSIDRLQDKGPVIAIFHRGGWYPYCNLELVA
jgi:peroxiredoxin